MTRKLWRMWALAALAAALGLAPRTASAAKPDPVNAAVLGTAATVLPIAFGASVLAAGRGFRDDARFTAGLTSIAVGSIIGPTTGQLYAGAGVDAAVTLSLRTLTGGLTVTGLGFTLRGSDEEVPAGVALLVVGGLTTAALAIYDILETPSVVREARIRAQRDPAELQELFSVAVCGPIPCPAGRPERFSEVRGL